VKIWRKILPRGSIHIQHHLSSIEAHAPFVNGVARDAVGILITVHLKRRRSSIDPTVGVSTFDGESKRQ
jgi:hypothetical protein